MVAKHAAITGQEAAAEAGRERTEPPEPATMEAAAQVVRDSLGEDAVAWERTFHRATTEDGSTVYVDARTGQMYDEMPRLHTKDGGDT